MAELQQNDTKISYRKFADYLGLSDTAVRKRVRSPQNPAGILFNSLTTTGKNGRPALWFETAKLEWVEGGGRIDNLTTQPEEEHEDYDDVVPNAKPSKEPPNQDAMQMMVAKKHLAVYNAQIKGMQLKKMQGDLVEKNKVYAVFFEFAQNIRDRFLQLPDKLITPLENHIKNGRIKEALNLLYSSLEAVLSDLEVGPPESKIIDDGKESDDDDTDE
jgi:hypothetical protein